MKKLILTFIFCGSLLLPVADLYAHGDPGTVLFALGLRKALETFAQKFELATASGQSLTVFYKDGVDSETDTLYFEQNGKYSAVEIPHLPVGLNMDTHGRKFLLINLLPINKEVETAAIFTGKNWYKMELLHLKRLHFYEARLSAYEAFCGKAAKYEAPLMRYEAKPFQASCFFP